MRGVVELLAWVWANIECSISSELLRVQLGCHQRAGALESVGVHREKLDL